MAKSVHSFILSLSLLFLFFSLAQAQDAEDVKADGVSAKHRTGKISSHRRHKTAALRRHEKYVKRVVFVHGRRRMAMQRVAYAPIVPAVPSFGELEGLNRIHDALDLRSNVALVLSQSDSQVLLDKNSDAVLPIASITKLMTALVVVEAKQDMNEILEITSADVDRAKNSSSRLRPGTQMSRGDMLHIALMSSENRAASALGRNYPGGLEAAIAAMNAKAKELGMNSTHYVEPTGLSSKNVSSARDLAKLVMAAQNEPLLCKYSTDPRYAVDAGGRTFQYANSNHLIFNSSWDILLQKTGYINEAGHCMLMRAMIEGRAIIMVLLDSQGKESRFADAGRIRRWLEEKQVGTHLASAKQS